MRERAPELAAVLLAAGASSRLGRPKQLLVYQGETLLRRAALLALAVGAAPLWVVLPPDAAAMQETLGGLGPLKIIENPNPSEGMGGSLRLAIHTILLAPLQPERVLLTVCDQPLLCVANLCALLEAPSPYGITAALYDGRPGVPAVFSRRHLAALAQVQGEHGARALLRLGNVTTMAMPQAAIDLDTPNDLLHLEVSSERSSSSRDYGVEGKL